MGPLTLGMLGGLALFLFGLDMMGNSLKGIAGNRLKAILGKLTRSRLTGFMTGAFFTAIIQSSSVTTALLVSFVAVGLLPLAQAIGVILGADVGTTITAQIFAFKVTKYALLFVVIGFFVQFLSKRDAARQWGEGTLGLGLIFYGMSLMSDAMAPLRDYEPFVMAMTKLSPLWSVVGAAVFTGLIQSSSAAMGVVIVLAMQGLISLETGIALAFGANIGTCATAGLAALGKPREAVRVAAAHVLFKVVGVAIAYPFLSHLAQFVEFISPAAAPDLSEMAARAAVVPRQVANAHTIFNVGIGLGFLPFTTLFARLLERMIPDCKEEKVIVGKVYLDKALVETPTLALGMTRLQINEMASAVETMITQLPDVILHGNLERAKELHDMDNEVDAQHQRIVDYLNKLGDSDLSEEKTDEAIDAATVSAELEAIGDIVETNFSHLARARAAGNFDTVPERFQEFTDYHRDVVKAFKSAVLGFVTDNAAIAQTVVDLKEEMIERQSRADANGFRAAREEGAGMRAHIWRRDVIENLQRIFYHSRRIAKIAATEAGVAAPDDGN